MCAGSEVSAEIEYAAIPLMDGVKDLAAKFVYPDSTMRNWKSFESKVEGINGESLITLCDPQTSGGLLIAVDPAHEEELFKIFLPPNTSLFKIGKITAKQEKQIIIS